LQGFCAKHSGMLAQQGICYPPWHPHFHHHYALFEHLQAAKDSKAIAWLSAQSQIATRSGAHTLFISQEQLNVCFSQSRQPVFSATTRFLSWARETFDDVELVCITREFRGYYRSYIKQMLNNTGSYRWDQQRGYARYLLNILRRLEEEGSMFFSLDEMRAQGPYPAVLLEELLGISIPRKYRKELRLNTSQDPLITSALVGTLISIDAAIQQSHPNSAQSTTLRESLSKDVALILASPGGAALTAELEAFFSERLEQFISGTTACLDSADLDALHRLMPGTQAPC